MDRLFTSKRERTGSIVAAGLWLVLLATVTTNSLAQVNKCNVNGRIVYTDSDCPDGSARKLQLDPLNIDSSKLPAGDPANGDSSAYNSSRWFNDRAGYAQALKISRDKNVPIFIYGYTDWCGYCKKLDKEMLNNAGVRKTLSGYVKVKINPEHSSADEALFKKWGGQGYPTLYIQTKYNTPPGRTPGPFTQQNGKWKLMDNTEFIAMLESKL